MYICVLRCKSGEISKRLWYKRSWREKGLYGDLNVSMPEEEEEEEEEEVVKRDLHYWVAR